MLGSGEDQQRLVMAAACIAIEAIMLTLLLLGRESIWFG